MRVDYRRLLEWVQLLVLMIGQELLRGESLILNLTQKLFILKSSTATLVFKA